MSESIEAERDGARLTSNSGRGWREKGDATLGDLFCIDYKEYTESFGVSRKVWAKITSDSLRMRRKPALKLVLGDGETKNKTRLWVIGEDVFKEMYDAWLQVYGD